MTKTIRIASLFVILFMSASILAQGRGGPPQEAAPPTNTLQNAGPLSGTTTPPASGTTTPPASGTTTPPASGTTTPPATETTTPPASGTTTPPASGTTTPPATETTTPPASGTTTPPADNQPPADTGSNTETPSSNEQPEGGDNQSENTQPETPAATGDDKSPTNPNAICLRAKITLRNAKKALDEARRRMNICKNKGKACSGRIQKYKLCKQLYKKALVLYNRVTVAKRETRVAIKRYRAIVQKAKIAEKKAIIEQSKVLAAKQFITRVEKHEYIVRKCKMRKRKLTKPIIRVVKTLRATVVKFKKHVTKITVQIKKLKSKVISAPAPKRPIIKRQITKLIHKRTTVIRRIHRITHSIQEITRPPRTFKPRRLVPAEKKVVTNLRVVIHKIRKQVTIVNRSIRIIRKRIPKLPVQKRPIFKRKLVVLIARKKKLVVRLHVTRMVRNSITRHTVYATTKPIGKPRKFTPVERKILRTIHRKFVVALKRKITFNKQLQVIVKDNKVNPDHITRNEPKRRRIIRFIKRIDRNVVHLKETMTHIQRLRFRPTKPQVPKIPKVIRRIVHRLVVKVNRYVKHIHHLHKVVEVLRTKEPKVPLAERPALRIRIRKIEHKITHLTHVTHNMTVSIKRMSPNTHVRKINIVKFCVHERILYRRCRHQIVALRRSCGVASDSEASAIKIKVAKLVHTCWLRQRRSVRVRRCFHIRPLTPKQKKTVIIMQKRLIAFHNTKIDIKRAIIALKTRLQVAPRPQRPKIRKEIRVLRKKIVRVTRHIVKVTHEVKHFSKGGPITRPTNPPGTVHVRPLNPTEKKVVHKITHTIHVYKKKIRIFHKKIVVLRHKLPRVPKPQRPKIVKLIHRYTHIVRKFTKKVVHLVNTRKQINNPAPVEIHELTPQEHKTVHRFIHKITVIRRKIKHIRRVIHQLIIKRQKAPEPERPTYTHKIVHYRKVIRRKVHIVRHYKRVVHRIRHPVSAITLIHHTHLKPTERRYVHIIHKRIHKSRVVIRRLRRKVAVIQAHIFTAPVAKRHIFIQKVKVIRRRIRRIITRVHHYERTVRNMITPIKRRHTCTKIVKKMNTYQFCCIRTKMLIGKAPASKMNALVAKYTRCAKKITYIRKTFKNCSHLPKFTLPKLPSRPLRPAKLTVVEKHAVKTFVHKKTVLVRQVKKITHQIHVIRIKLQKAPKPQKPVYRKQITKLVHKVHVIRRHIVRINHVVRAVKFVPRRPAPTRVAVKRIFHKITVVNRRIYHITRIIRKLVVRLPKAPKPQKPVIIRKIRHYTTVFRKNVHIVHVYRQIVKKIIKPNKPTIKPKPLTPILKKFVHKQTITVKKYVHKVHVYHKKLVVLQNKLPKLPAPQLPKVIKQINVIRRKIVVINHKIHKIHRFIHVVHFGRPVYPKPAKIVKIFHHTVHKIHRKIVVLKKTVKVLKVKYNKAPAPQKPIFRKKIVKITRKIQHYMKRIHFFHKTVDTVKKTPKEPIFTIQPVKPIKYCTKRNRIAYNRKYKFCQRRFCGSCRQILRKGCAKYGAYKNCVKRLNRVPKYHMCAKGPKSFPTLSKPQQHFVIKVYKRVRKITKVIKKYKKVIKVLKIKYTKAPAPQKPTIKKQIVKITHKVFKLTKVVRHIRRIVHQTTVIPQRPKPVIAVIKRITKVEKHLNVVVHKTIVRIRHLVHKLPTLPKPQRPKVIRQITFLRRKVVRVYKHITRVRHVRFQITRPQKPIGRPIKPSKPTIIFIKKLKVKKIHYRKVIKKLRIVYKTLQHQIPKQPVTKLPVFFKKIHRVVHKINVTVHKLHHVTRFIHNVTYVRPTRPVPHKVIMKRIRHVFKRVIHVTKKRIVHYRHVIKTLTAKLPKLPAKQKPIVRRRIVFYKKTVRKLVHQVKVYHHTVHVASVTHTHHHSVHVTTTGFTVPKIPKTCIKVKALLFKYTRVCAKIERRCMTNKSLISQYSECDSFKTTLKAVKVKVCTKPIRPSPIKSCNKFKRGLGFCKKAFERTRATFPIRLRNYKNCIKRLANKYKWCSYIKPTLPEKLSPVQTTYVHKVTKVYKKFVHKVTVIRHKIHLIKIKYQKAPKPQKPAIKKQIIKLTHVYHKYVKKVRVYKKIIRHIDFKPTLPGPIKVVVHKYHKIIRHVVRRNKVFIHKITVLIHKLKKAPKPQRPKIVRQIIIIRRRIVRNIHKIHRVYKVISHITRPQKPTTMPIKPIKETKPFIHKQHVVIKKLFVHIKKVRAQIHKLVISVPKVAPEQLPVVFHKIHVLRKTVHKYVHKVHHVQRVIYSTTFHAPKPNRKVIIARIRKITHHHISVIRKRIVHIKKRIIVIRKKYNKAPAHKKLYFKRIIKRLTVVVKHLKHEIHFVHKTVVTAKHTPTRPKPMPKPAPEDKCTKVAEEITALQNQINSLDPTNPTDIVRLAELQKQIEALQEQQKKCEKKQEPKPTPKEAKHFVQVYKKTIHKYVKRVRVIRKQITVLVHKYKTAPAPQKPTILKQITVLRHKYVKIVHKVKRVKRVYINITRRPYFPKPIRKVTRKYTRIVRKITHRIVVYRKTVHRLIIRLRKAPKPQRPKIIRKIRKIRVIVNKLHVKRTVYNKVIRKIRHAIIRPGKPRKLTPREVTFVKHITKVIRHHITHIKKLTIVRNKIVKKMYTAPKPQRPVFRQRIYKITHKIRVIRHTIRRYKNVVQSVKFTRPVTPKPAVIFRRIHKVLTRIRHVNHTKIVHYTKLIHKLRVVIKTAKPARRPIIRRRINVLVRKVHVLKKVTHVFHKVVRHVKFVRPHPVIRPMPVHNCFYYKKSIIKVFTNCCHTSVTAYRGRGCFTRRIVGCSRRCRVKIFRYRRFALRKHCFKEVPVPRKLTKFEHNFVQHITHKVKQLVKRVTVYKHKVVVLRRKPKTPKTIKVIRKLVVKIRRINKDIKHYTKTIRKVKFTIPKHEVVRPKLPKAVKRTIRKIRTEIHHIRTKVYKIRKIIRVLKIKRRQAPKPRKIVYTRRIRRFVKKVHVYVKRITVKNNHIRVIRGEPVAPARPLTHEEKKIIRVFKHKVYNFVTKIHKVRKTIFHLRHVLKTAPAPKRPVIVKKIHHFEHKVVKYENHIRHIKDTIYRIAFKPKHMTPAQTVKVMKQKTVHIKKVIAKLTKKTTVVKHKIAVIKKQIHKVHVQETKVTNKLDKIEAKIDKIRPHPVPAVITCSHSMFHGITCLKGVSDLTCMHPKTLKTKIIKIVKKIRRVVHRITVIKRKIHHFTVQINKLPATSPKRPIFIKKRHVLVHKVTVLRHIVHKHILVIKHTNKKVSPVKRIYSCAKPAIAPIQKVCHTKQTKCSKTCAQVAHCSGQKRAMMQDRCGSCSSTVTICEDRIAYLRKPSKLCLRPKKEQVIIRNTRKVIRTTRIKLIKLVTKRNVVRRAIRRYAVLIVKQPKQKTVFIKKIKVLRVTLHKIITHIKKVRIVIRHKREVIKTITKKPVSVFTHKQITVIRHAKVTIVRARKIIHHALIRIPRVVRIIRRLRQKIVKVTVHKRRVVILRKIHHYTKIVHRLHHIVTKARHTIFRSKFTITRFNRVRAQKLKPVFTCQHSSAVRNAIRKFKRCLKQPICSSMPMCGMNPCFDCRRHLRRLTQPSLSCMHPKPQQIKNDKLVTNIVHKVFALRKTVVKVHKLIVRRRVLQKKLIVVPAPKKPVILAQIKKITTVIRKIRNVIVHRRQVIHHVSHQIHVISQPPKGIITTKPFFPKPSPQLKPLLKKLRPLIKKHYSFVRKIHHMKTTLHHNVHVLHHIHRSLIVNRATIKRAAVLIRNNAPESNRVHYLHKVFRCKVIRLPELSGPFPGTGDSKLVAVTKLIAGEKREIARMAARIRAFRRIMHGHMRLRNRLRNRYHR